MSAPYESNRISKTFRNIFNVVEICYCAYPLFSIHTSACSTGTIIYIEL